MVPEGWTLMPLAKLLEKVIDYRGKAPPKTETGTRLITARNVRMGFVSFEHAEFIDENLYLAWMNRGLPRGGDVMFTTEAPLGNVAMFPETGTYALGQRIVTLRPKADVVSGFLFQYLLSDLGQSKVQEKASGSTALGIKSKELVKITIPVPPLHEQQKIADILSTWDKAIETTEALLANARTQKRALMQSLLTGTRRFPEFEGQPWREVRLGDVIVGKRRKGKIVDTNFEKLGCPYIGAASLGGVFDAYTETKDAVLCKPEDLLVLWDGENAGQIGVGLAGAVSSTVVQYHLKLEVIEARYIYYRMLEDREKIRAAREGSGIPHMPGDFETWYRFQLPPILEQKKIVDTIDIPNQQEMELSGQLHLLRTEKKALMQQLLTGKRRVVV